ncbi:hypothetical protein PVAND_000869 [Polypedilum vanderplanki]|uniref:Carrier domain-containing protein n=1 Tax=Polypedilum vanderplanki TaxID=319348 RepID=A0A9J6BL81_POLVA|nr:hypothetical protein PVAND_000869 [Polypedilum vanderplanki]
MQSLASFLEQHDVLLSHPVLIVASTVTIDKTSISNRRKDFVEILMEVLNIEDRKSISMSSTFSQLGINSLAGIELQQMIGKENIIYENSSNVNAANKLNVLM